MEVIGGTWRCVGDGTKNKFFKNKVFPIQRALTFCLTYYCMREHDFLTAVDIL